ncbi:MAG: hypothetical protein ACD_61C00260G0002, partial [uncultured bacterium]
MLSTESLTVFGFEVEIAGTRGDRDGGASELDAQKIFQMTLNFQKIVLIFFQQSVVDGVAQIPLPAVDKGDHIRESQDIFFVIGGGDEGNEIPEQIGDGDDLIAFVGTDNAGFAAGVHAGANTGDVGEACLKQGLDDHRS